LRHVRREWALLSFHSVCLTGCLSVIPRPIAYHDWSITTKFGRQVYTCPRTRVSLFGSPISHTFGAKGKNMQISAYFQRQPFNAYSCHCERDASCHITCLSVRSHNTKTTTSNFTRCDTLCTSGFVDHMLSCRWVNGPESSMRLCLEGVRQLAVPVERQTNFSVWPSSPECGTVVKSNIYDLFVWF